MAGAAAATVLLAGTVAAFWPVPVLEVTSGTGRTLWARPLRGPMEVRLEYRHSVERTAVVEVYVAEPGAFRFTRMEFVSQGAGLPTSGYVREGGRFVLREVRELAGLPVRVSRLTAPRLIVDGDRLDLLSLAGDGGAVVVGRGRRPRAALWFGRPARAP